jgi:hypothetical protein
MATGAGDELEAAGRGHLRASHADRERVIGTLKAAFVQGRLTKDELDARAGQAFASRTYAELAALTADLPPGLADAAPLGSAAPAQARRPVSNAARAGLWAAIAVAVPVVLSLLAGNPTLFLLFTPFYFTALAFLGAEITVSWDKKSPDRRQLPPGPAPGLGDQTSPHRPSAGPGGQPPTSGPRQRHTAGVQRRRLPHPARPVRRPCAGGALAAGTTPASG